jgi:hypothetical protein
MPTWMHWPWFLAGVLAGWTLTSVFWCWTIERRERVARERDRHYRMLVREQDATLRGLYQQTSRLAAFAIQHYTPEARHQSLAWWPTRES